MTVIQTYLIYALAALLAISIGINIIYHFDRASLIAANTSLTTTAKRLTEQVKLDTKTILSQNDAINKAASKSKDNDRRISDLGTKLAAQTVTNQALIDKLNNQPAPKTCDDAVIYLKNNLGIFQW
jgi:type IV secretory pathway VirJ component